MLNLKTENLLADVNLGDLSGILVDKDGTIIVHLCKSAENEAQADRICRQVRRAGGGCQKRTYYNEYMEAVNDRKDAEYFMLYCKIENDQTRVYIQLHCKI